MGFNNWPYTNFQDLNLGWILRTYKNAIDNSTEAKAKAEAVEDEVGTYSDRISNAENNASEALNTANSVSDVAENAVTIATRAENTANGISATAQNALAVANQANATANSIKQTCNLIVSGNTVTYNGVVLTGADIHQLFADGKYPYCIYSDGNGTNYVYKPDVYAVLGSLYTQSFTCITPASAAGADYELLKRLVIINGAPQFATDVELASTDYVDSQSGGGSTDAVLYTAQTLTSAQKRQARSNIGAGKSTVTVSNSVMTIVDADTGSQNAYPIGGTGDLPAVSTADNGKFLRVVSGAWAAATVPNAETTSFGTL